MESAEQITAKAKSNLAFVFLGLPPDKKRDMIVFYAFCRVVDDIADEIGPSPEEKHKGLDRWVYLVENADSCVAENAVEADMLRLFKNKEVDREACLGLIAGCRSDVVPQRYESLTDLLGYTYRVASCVGLVIITLFGASKAAREYVINLGHALQLTNILRDVGEDWEKEERIYVPQEYMARFGYTESALRKAVYNDAFIAMMTALADKADEYYAAMESCYQKLSSADKKALSRTEAMRNIYQAILTKMRRDGFRVFTTRYSLSKWQKITLLLKAWVKSLWV